MSKFGLAGVRIGYLMGRSQLIDELDKLRPPFNVSVLNCEAALFALDHADEYARQAALMRSERERLAALRALPGVQPFPSEANMVLVRVPDAAGLRRHEEPGRAGQAHRRAAPAAGTLPALTVGTPAENDADDQGPGIEPLNGTA
jgi:histidinol-phosphate aminotransferase